MLTVLDLLNKTTDYFSKKKIESPRLNAELLLASVLECKRLDLYLSFDKPLPEKDIEVYRELIKRRATFEPLQYIIGNVDFFGIQLKVNKHVLIPRPETEILVESILGEIDKSKLYRILDIGTGSGNIAISLALNIPNVEVIAIDISDEAINVAKENAEMNSVSEKITFLNCDILVFEDSALSRISDSNGSKIKYDIVVSNPPYVRFEEYNELQKEIVAFEPQFAVTDFGDGYKFYRTISSLADKIIAENGKVFFEIGKDQHIEIIEILKENSIKNISVIKDYSGISRIIKGERIASINSTCN